MQLIPKWAKLDFAMLPIGDNFTMDVSDAVICSNFIECNKVVGMHYDTFGFIKIDHEAAIGAFRSAGKSLLLPAIGTSLDI
jgi:L-ascorbate metabolism protein UlaG (beta-lactamase superfamily)